MILGNTKEGILNKYIGNETYTETAKFAVWLQKSPLLPQLDVEGVRKLLEYVVESERGDAEMLDCIEEGKWEHLVHAQLFIEKKKQKCLVCEVKNVAEDYLLYQELLYQEGHTIEIKTEERR